MRYFSAKSWAFLGFTVGIAALGAALFFQISKDWFPCPLCIVQRYAYMVAALGFLGICLSRRGSFAYGLFVLLAAVGCLSGAVSAFYHVWVLANPMQTCGVDPLQNTLNTLPWAAYWPEMFMADGLCTDEYPPLFGLSLPMWAAVGFVVQGFALVMALQARKQFKGSW
jgi:protein dithiol:quinone oxidoreductase